ncbi:Adaptor protein complex AP-2 alpha subunit [Yamadazyma tenuis ATCC 10573]|uniref:AP-2 complex subunit alpha n=2 Tax=Candida tenuis TaxID=2315449 RepID=G3B8Y2_CANTC|nr:Adaptor protein complex AP-2 alpha subunit [Yamadazyma tenuis ATCC 10573]EGV61804.1 Adaptor protein complex AP-2 alpha subunit [Yamadazyma tenuis ATCC 10573]
MKGLTQFIIDIRNSQDFEQEKKRINLEINNIRTKFSSNLSTYQRKKYICKLMYIYLSGYDDLVDLGVKESLSLISAKTIQEKSLGYLTLSIIFTSHSDTAHTGFKGTNTYFEELLGSVYSQLSHDLKIDNEIFNALALQFIANNFNLPGYQLPETSVVISKFLELANQVYSFAISPMSALLLKKKSLVCLKMLIQLYPNLLVVNDNWIPRLFSLVDYNNDLSIILNGLPVAELVVGMKPTQVKNLVASLTNNLEELVINANCDESYFYYGIPAPWVTIRLLQLLETCFLMDSSLVINLNPKDLKTLKQVISTSINQSTKSINALSNKNIQSSILFQSVGLAIFLNASSESILGAINALLHLLKSTDTNTRYLALDVLIKLISRSSDEKLTQSYNGLIFDRMGVAEHLLNDKDIGIKRKTLDLFYIITNDSNYQVIINKLLDYFPMLDYQLKSELSIKIAILAEKFAKDSTWYVNIMIRLLSIPGSSANSEFLNNEIWERIIQIIVNNDELHVKTCKLLMGKLIRSDQLSENLVKMSAFLIGEYGSLIKNEFPPQIQFQALYKIYVTAGLVSRSMILSTFIKFCNCYPDEDFIPNIIDLFEIEKDSIDIEIQSRANEYLNMFTMNSKGLLSNIIRPLPPFETKKNHLLSRIGTLNHIVGTDKSSFMVNAAKIQKKTTNGNGNGNGSLIDLGGPEADFENPFQEEKLVLSPNWYNGYHRMLHFDAGIFYESQLARITYKVDRIDDFKLLYKLQVINNSYKSTSNQLTSFKILELKSNANTVDPSYIMNLTKTPDQIILDKSSIEIEVKVRGVVDVEQSPVLSISFSCGGSFNQLNLKFPVNVLKTLTPTTLLVEEFKTRWLQINQLLPNNKGEFTIRPNTAYKYTASNIVRLVQRLRFSIVFSSSEDDPNKVLVLAAGILHTQTNNYGVLLSIKSVGTEGKHFEITAKCTGEGVAEIIAVAMGEIFQGKF